MVFVVCCLSVAVCSNLCVATVRRFVVCCAAFVFVVRYSWFVVGCVLFVVCRLVFLLCANC